MLYFSCFNLNLLYSFFFESMPEVKQKQKKIKCQKATVRDNVSGF